MWTAQPFLPILAGQPDANGRTPFHYAVASGYFALIDTLVEHGADPLAPDPLDGSSALHHLVRELRNTNCLKLLDLQAVLGGPRFTNLTKSLNTDNPSEDRVRQQIYARDFPAHEYEQAERRSACRHIADFLARGGSINARDNVGETPLFKLLVGTFRRNHNGNVLLYCLRELEKAGADFAARNCSGESALHKLATQRNLISALHGHDHISKSGLEPELVEATKWLVAKGVDVTWEDERNRTCLDVAASTGAGWMLDMYKRK